MPLRGFWTIERWNLRPQPDDSTVRRISRPRTTATSPPRTDRPMPPPGARGLRGLVPRRALYGGADRLRRGLERAACGRGRRLAGARARGLRGRLGRVEGGRGVGRGFDRLPRTRAAGAL